MGFTDHEEFHHFQKPVTVICILSFFFKHHLWLKLAIMANNSLFLYLSAGALSTEAFHSVHAVSVGTTVKNQDGGAFSS